MEDKMNISHRGLWRPVVTIGLTLALTAGIMAFGQAGRVDPQIAAYKKVSGVSGSISSVGSDTLNNVMTMWGETFGKFYPSVRVQVEGKGSGTAPPALIAGTAQLGPMSRQMKATELDGFEKKYGYKPTEVKVAVDTIAVWVHKDNPIKGLTLEQVDAIFSKTHRRGKGDITTWGQLGLTGEWASKPISMYGRNSVSGTYGFFKEHVLQNGDYKNEVKEQPGSAAVVQGVTVDKYAIGYSGIGYKTAGVRAVPLAEKQGAAYVAANAANAYSGKYPIWRFLYVYINRAPGKPLDPLVKEFMTMALSREGQEVVVKDGFFPLPAAVVRQEWKKIE